MRPQHSVTERRLVSVRLLSVLTVAISILLAALVLLAHWVWNPPQRPTEHADAVVVLAYGQDRVKLGRTLVEDGVADNLVFSLSARVQERIAERSLPVLSPEEVEDGLGASGPWLEECGADYGSYQVECVYPDPNSTVGEAVAVERLMKENGWESIAIVTERSHMRRALATFDSCTSGQVFGEQTPGVGSPDRVVRRTIIEMVATVRDGVRGTC